MTGPSQAELRKLKTYRSLLLGVSILAFLLIVAGGVLRVTNPGGVCTGMPFCDVGLGSALSLGLSLVVLGVSVVAAVVAFYELHYRSLGHESRLLERLKPFSRSPKTRLVLITAAAVFVLLVSGTILTGLQANDACASWPLCENGLALPDSLAGWAHTVHRLIVIAVGMLMLWLAARTWKTQRSNTPMLVASTIALVLFTAQALLGSQFVSGYPVHLLIIHQATAIAVWATMVTLAVIAVYSPVPENYEIHEIHEWQEQVTIPKRASVSQLFKDFLMLTKPIVVLLLLVTTYAGMVIGAQSWPSASLTFWTLLGGFLAAGGSGAINQYIDRKDDGKMQRTQKRPIPAGRLTPGEGLAFGAAITLVSFYVMVAFVNFLAALLTLVGIIYYVLIYSIFLKKTTVQNIVIGGGAGAIPPLVGWAAATGSLNVPSLFLFAVVFMWTPPHFWALALVRRKDYARAGVPMLPVVRGEGETRWQIFIYTVALVALTMLLPFFGLGGSVYVIGAGLLGVWLLMAAWKVWKRGGNKLAWKMYRYSSMYLAFIFVVLMVDRLL